MNSKKPSQALTSLIIDTPAANDCVAASESMINATGLASLLSIYEVYVSIRATAAELDRDEPLDEEYTIPDNVTRKWEMAVQIARAGTLAECQSPSANAKNYIKAWGKYPNGEGHSWFGSDIRSFYAHEA